jgi:hypothetical protein
MNDLVVLATAPVWLAFDQEDFRYIGRVAKEGHATTSTLTRLVIAILRVRGGLATVADLDVLSGP